METATTHEARARNAKAQALAEILHEASASPADLATEPFALGSAGWARAAAEATRRHLMGTKPNGDPVKVNVPHSRATIDAVARILGDLIAHEADQAAIAEQVAPAVEATVYEHSLDGEPCDTGPERPDDALCSAHGRLLRVAGASDGRRPTDSQGYRSTVGQLDPETAQAFAAFNGMAR